MRIYNILRLETTGMAVLAAGHRSPPDDARTPQTHYKVLAVAVSLTVQYAYN